MRGSPRDREDGMVPSCRTKSSCTAALHCSPQPWAPVEQSRQELGSCNSSTSATSLPSKRINSFTNAPLQYPHTESERWTGATPERETRLSLRGGKVVTLVCLRGLRSGNEGSQSTSTRQRFWVWKVIQDEAREGELSLQGYKFVPFG